MIEILIFRVSGIKLCLNHLRQNRTTLHAYVWPRTHPTRKVQTDSGGLDQVPYCIPGGLKCSERLLGASHDCSVLSNTHKNIISTDGGPSQRHHRDWRDAERRGAEHEGA